MEGRNSGQVFRFGLFEVDLRTHELLKNGRPVRIQEQPFQVLAALLERPQQMVSREELHRRIWPGDTFVDFENSLNVAVNRLREALNDSATNPRFIETLPRRGYRFIAPAEVISGNLPSARARSEAPAIWSRKFVWLSGPVAILAVLVAITAFVHTPTAVRVAHLKQLTNAKLAIPNNGGTLDSPLLTDGSRLYFSAMQQGRLVVQQLGITGGDPIPVPAPFENTDLLDLSRDGTELLVGSLDDRGTDAMQLWILPTTGGPPRRVGNVRAGGAGWSPDGSQIVYATGTEVFIATRDGSNARRLTRVACDCSVLFPRWSPDGRRLRFTVENYADQTSTLWEIPAQGGDPQPVFPDWNGHHTRKGSWTSDGKLFVFDDYHNAWARSEETNLLSWRFSVPVQLTDGPLRMFSVIPSRDTRKLFAVGERSQGEVLRYKAETRSFERFLDGLSAEGIEFSRDGEWMVYVSFPEGTLWRMRADGRDRVQLTSPPLVADLPRWSPDGSRIAFTGQVVGKPVNVYIVNADGSNLHPLPGSEWRIAPTWAPDSKSVAFATGAQQRDLTLYNLESGATSVLSRGEAFLPLWSPDGRYILAARPGPPRLELLEVETGEWRDLAVGSPFPNQWAWSRDGRYVYLDFPLGKNATIQRMRLSDGLREKVADVANVARSQGNFDLWFGLDPQDSPLVLRDLSSQQIYVLELQP